MVDILDRIVEDRRADLKRLGPTLGVSVPEQRNRGVVGFLQEKGAIFEIKRASPSKGPIAMDLDPMATVRAYASAGVQNISVLTEGRYFKGSLADLIALSTAFPNLAFLRKDFILESREIGVSYRAGADAVLLIARLLPSELLSDMVRECGHFGLTPLVEVRDSRDLEKLKGLPPGIRTITGVNARDLATFTVDPLVPAGLIDRIQGPAVYESGIGNPGMAAFAGKLGFTGILVGEGVVKESSQGPALVAAFKNASYDGVGRFWRAVGRRRMEKNGTAGETTAPKGPPRNRPLVKICGLTIREDVQLSMDLGADLLGFVFAESKRTASVAVVEEARRIRGADRFPLLVAVLTELDSALAESAITLARAGVLDGIQWHGEPTKGALDALERALSDSQGRALAGRYGALRIGSPEDILRYDSLRKEGEARLLVDSRVPGLAGGTGTAISETYVPGLAERKGLWLAGGLGPDTIRAALAAYNPELVDASSRLEREGGRKDPMALKLFFQEINTHGA
jgi:indole-3-glycerol phosphate synthase/phosphoribosylanthranilate isomerase